jgi:hypothetical protein
MEVPDGEEPCFEFFYPDQLTGILAFGAVPVSAGVVADFVVITLVAEKGVTAHGGSPAGEYGRKGLLLTGRKMQSGSELFPASSEDIGKFWSMGPLVGRFHQRVSNGLLI